MSERLSGGVIVGVVPLPRRTVPLARRGGHPLVPLDARRAIIVSCGRAKLRFSCRPDYKVLLGDGRILARHRCSKDARSPSLEGKGG